MSRFQIRTAASILLLVSYNQLMAADPADSLEIHLAVQELPMLRLRGDNQAQLQRWKGELGSKVDEPK